MSIDSLLILLAVIGNTAWAVLNWRHALRTDQEICRQKVWLMAQLREMNRMLEREQIRQAPPPVPPPPR